MIPSIEDKIWDTITNSAKNKFDYLSFKQFFPFDPDNIIFKIILHLANNNEKEIIVLELYNDLLLTGIKWDKTEITEFLAGKENLFKEEIYVSQLAKGMLDNGTDPTIVMTKILQLLPNLQSKH